MWGHGKVRVKRQKDHPESQIHNQCIFWYCQDISPKKKKKKKVLDCFTNNKHFPEPLKSSVTLLGTLHGHYFT